jgi:hypothetical protein
LRISKSKIPPEHASARLYVFQLVKKGVYLEHVANLSAAKPGILPQRPGREHPASQSSRYIILCASKAFLKSLDAAGLATWQVV